MCKRKSKLQVAQEQAEDAIKRTNACIDELGRNTSSLFARLRDIQSLFDAIRNVPSEKRLQYEQLKEVRLNWKQQAEKIESDHKRAIAAGAGKGAAGVGVGVATVALGPTAAMGIATTFGVASTGTAISTLSGAAATNAALAWLGGGALAAGGGGMAAGNVFLTLFGPVGWSIAGVALLSSGIIVWKTKADQRRLEKVFTLISERDIKSYNLAIVELNERIARIIDESAKLDIAIERAKSFGTDYARMTEANQYELGSYINLMAASTQLLVNPILGLLPKYTAADFDLYLAESTNHAEDIRIPAVKNTVVALSLLLYRISIDEKDKTLLWKSFRSNREFLATVGISKKEFEISILDTVSEALKYKYECENMLVAQES